MRLGAFVGDTVNVVSPVGPISAMGMVPKIRTFAVVALPLRHVQNTTPPSPTLTLQRPKVFQHGRNRQRDRGWGADTSSRDRPQRFARLRLRRTDLDADESQRFSLLKLEKTMMLPLLLVLITIVASFNIVSTLTMMIVTEAEGVPI
ncbi:MAG: hypothetical protein U0412_13670 [Nitrospira sp.]